MASECKYPNSKSRKNGNIHFTIGKLYPSNSTEVYRTASTTIDFIITITINIAYIIAVNGDFSIWYINSGNRIIFIIAKIIMENTAYIAMLITPDFK